MPRLSILLIALSAATPIFGCGAQSWSERQFSESAVLRFVDLMQLLSRRDHGTVRFRETRHFTRLKDEVVVTGVLSFRRPDRLTKIVEQPKWEQIDVTRNEVTIRSGDATPPRVIQLAEFPALNGMIVALRATLTGDERELLEHFAIHLVGTKDNWRLSLLPRTNQIREKIAEIIIVGKDDRPNSFSLTQSNGDRVVIQIIEQWR